VPESRRPNLVASEVLRRARLNHACPRCGAGPGARCYTLYRDGVRAAVGRDLPHPERITLAWRAFNGEARR
jgi:hypothetical protein